MRQKARRRDRRSESSSDLVLQTVQKSDERLLRRLCCVSKTKSVRSRDRPSAGISIETTVKRLATYMVGWRGCLACAKLRGADRPYSLGAAQAAMRTLATVENSKSPASRVAATGNTSATCRQYGWYWSRPLVLGPLQSPVLGGFEFILPLARATFTVRELLA